MPEMIPCPVCGEPNAADQEFCQYCQSRLQPLTGALKGADAPLTPGQVPTRKVTAELEPILPQWLREARDKARHSAEEDLSQTLKQQAAAPGPASAPDLLAGLHSQSADDGDDDTPDWLANITGAPARPKRTGPQPTEARRVELGGREDFAPDVPPAAEEESAWLNALQTPPPAGEKDELTEWFRESSGLDVKEPGSQPLGAVDSLRADAGPAYTESAGPPFEAGQAPEWLDSGSIEAEAGSAGMPGGAIPSWLGTQARNEPATGPSPFIGTGTAGIDAGDVPNWLRGLDAGESASPSPAEDEWLREHQARPADPPLKKHTTPLWLKGLDPSGAAQDEPETPVWLTEMQSEPVAPPAAPPSLPAEEEDSGDIPSWLKAAAPQSSVYSEPAAEQVSAAPPEASDWMAAFKTLEPQAPVEAPSAPFSAESSAQAEAPAAFTTDAFQDGSADNLFTEMPDWLTSAAAPPSPAAAAEPDALMPGELPSWVQAMRPVDLTASRPEPLPGDQTLETRGALSGLHGVLPAVPGFTPTSKPRAYSIKLQATQEQQAHAALLEQILAAEAEPVPISSQAPLRKSTGLRWFIALVMLTVTLSMAALNLGFFSAPAGLPAEIRGALAVAQSVPEGAPVLVAIDYHPARSAEMEAAAAPMFDQMMVLRHPRLTFLSTNETGPVLAEQFVSGTLRERGYTYGDQYLNLGYLPGGIVGIRAFILNPRQAMPLDIKLDVGAWDKPPLQGVAGVSQFAALIVITDSTDTVLAWIEQTEAARRAAPFPLVVISSAQAAPLVRPYFEAGQVSGMIDGLYGGVVFEANNAGRPGTALAYWDAYITGMLVAMAFILGGGLWSAFLALQARAEARRGG